MVLLLNLLLGFGLKAYVVIGADKNGKKLAQVLEIRWPGPVGNPTGMYNNEILENSSMANEADGAII